MIDQAFDVDWFALDRNDRILHFASGGGRLPLVIKDSIDDDSMNVYIQALQELTGDVLVSNGLSKFWQLARKERDAYLNDFTKMCRKGLFSFDKTLLGQPLNQMYHLVCRPKNPLLLGNLPVEIRSQLLRMRLDFDVEKINQIDLSLFL